MSVQKLTQALSDMKCGMGMNDFLFLFMHCLLTCFPSNLNSVSPG